MYGCIRSTVDLRDFKLNKRRVRAVNYPSKFQLEMNVPVKNQKTVSSCVAHAASSILEYHEKGEFKELSTNFIYGIRNRLYNSEGEGMMLRDALRIAYSYGDMTEADCKGNIEVDDVYDIASMSFNDMEKRLNAYKYRIKKYTLLLTDSDVKYALTNFGPVLTCVKWYDGYKVDRNNGLVKFDKTTDWGFHALVVYGWNEKGWLVQNSWGRAWGKSGTCVIPFGSLVESYAVIDDETLDSDSVIINPSRGNLLIETCLMFLNGIINLFRKK